MGTWTSNATFEGDPILLMDVLTELEAIERWSPVPFRLNGCDECLQEGDQVAVEGALLGRGVRFDVDVEQADATGLRLHAHGPFEIDVEYTIEAESSRVTARVETTGRGPRARMLTAAANAMLKAGALDLALQRVVREAALTRAAVSV